MANEAQLGAITQFETIQTILWPPHYNYQPLENHDKKIISIQ